MTVQLVDVSEWQGTIDWAAYAAGGYQAAVARVAYGNSHVDTQWHANQAGMRQYLRIRGYYQYIVAAQDISSQANYFVGLVGKLQPGEFVVADIEEGSGDLTTRATTWNSVVHAAIGNEEWIYSGYFFAKQHLDGFAGMRYVWLAAYQSTDPYPTAVLWQHTDVATFPGVRGQVDGSVFNGTWDDLYALVAGSPGPTPNPQPVTGDTEMIKSVDTKNDAFILVDPNGAVFTFWGNGASGGFYHGGLNTLSKHNVTPLGIPVAANHYDDGNPNQSAYVIMTRELNGTFHEYQFPTNNSAA